MYKIIGADGKEYGPISLEQIRQWITEGRLNLQSQILPEGATQWQTLAEIPELAAAVPPPAASMPAFGSAPVKDIPNYLVQSILVTLCCCLPFGIVAIVYAAQVKSKLSVGDVAGAQQSSDKAKMWCWIGFGVGIVANIIVGIVQFMMMRATGGGSF